MSRRPQRVVRAADNDPNVANAPATEPNKKRKRAPEKPVTSEIGWVRHMVHSPMVQTILDALPTDTAPTGRRRQYTDWIMVVTYLICGKLSTRRTTLAVLPDPLVWSYVTSTYQAIYGSDAPALGGPPSRSQYHRFLATRLSRHLGLIADLMRDRAVTIAAEMGVLDPNAPRSSLHPTRAQTVVGDGTVFRPPISGPRTKREVTERHRALGGDWWTEAGDDKHPFYGIAYTSISARLDDLDHRRLVMDVRRRPAKGNGGEIAQGVEMILELNRREQVRVDAVAWDGAMRGQHAHDILGTVGAVVVRPAREDDKPRPLTRVDHCGCGTIHELYTNQTAICVKVVLDDGSIEHEPLPIIQVRRTGRAGKYRWYHELALPCGVLHRERIDTVAAEDKGNVNRAERIQPIPPHLPEHAGIYGRREDTEARHRELDDQMYARRLPYYIPAHQDLYLLAEALASNERTLAEWHASQEPGQRIA